MSKKDSTEILRIFLGATIEKMDQGFDFPDSVSKLLVGWFKAAAIPDKDLGLTSTPKTDFE